MNRMLSEPIPFGRLVDCGMREYGEFACSVETAEWLAAGGMRRVDGREVWVQVVDVAAGGNVICAARPRVAA